MSRPMTAAMAKALKGGAPRALIVEIEHPDGIGRFWSSIGTLAWNGETWAGTGVMGSVSPVTQTSDLSIQEMSFALSGVDPEVVSQLSDTVRNLSGRAWLACLNDRGGVVRNPYELIDAVLDYQTFEVADDGSGAQIKIIARSGFYTLERAIDECWSPEDQKVRYPGDTGLDMLPLLEKQDVLWTPS